MADNYCCVFYPLKLARFRSLLFLQPHYWEYSVQIHGEHSFSNSTHLVDLAETRVDISQRIAPETPPVFFILSSDRKIEISYNQKNNRTNNIISLHSLTFLTERRGFKRNQTITHPQIYQIKQTKQ